MFEWNEIKPLQIVVMATENARNYIHDSGPLYHEFHADSLIKEPWNAISSLFFLAPVIFWLWKLRGRARGIAALALVGFVGKTTYEHLTGATVFVDHAEAGFVPVVSAHITGVLSGFVVGAWPGRRRARSVNLDGTKMEPLLRWKEEPGRNLFSID
jgi:hypothetical protein